MHTFQFHLLKYSVEQPREIELSPQEEELLQAALANPDYRMYPHIFNILQRRGLLAHDYFKDLINPYEPEDQDSVMEKMLSGVGPDVSVQTAREGEMERPGWLNASHRAYDEGKSQPGQPYHPYTKTAQEAIRPGEVYRYDVEIVPTSNVFKRDHRICLELSSIDIPAALAVTVRWSTFLTTFVPVRRWSTRSTGARGILPTCYCLSFLASLGDQAALEEAVN